MTAKEQPWKKFVSIKATAAPGFVFTEKAGATNVRMIQERDDKG